MTYWVLMGFTAALYYILKKKTSALSKWYVKSLLYAIFGVSLAQTIVGGWLSRMMRTILGWFGLPAGMIGAALVVLAVVVLVIDVAKDRKADKLAQISILMLPLLFVFAAGPIAPTGRNLTDSFANISINGLAFLTGA